MITISPNQIDPGFVANVGVLLYHQTAAVHGLLTEAIALARARGVTVGGLIQRVGGIQSNGKPSYWLDDIETGRSIRLDEPRGPGARSCVLDVDALAQGAWLLRQTIQARPEIIIVSRFGALEAEGHGLRSEIADAICSGAGVIIPVRETLCADLEAFLGCQPLFLPPQGHAIADWAATLRVPT